MMTTAIPDNSLQL